jgi:hypothetical protein
MKFAGYRIQFSIATIVLFSAIARLNALATVLDEPGVANAAGSDIGAIAPAQYSSRKASMASEFILKTRNLTRRPNT